jgi:hypothetical protein
MNIPWDISDGDMCLYLDNGLWKGFVYKDNKYYFDDSGTKNVNALSYYLDQISKRGNGNLKVPKEQLDFFWEDLNLND